MLGAAWFGAMMVYYTARFPDPMSVHGARAPTLKILSRDGSLLAERDSKHLYIPIGMLPRHVTDAVVAVEDRRFNEHIGVDFSGLARAAFANLRAGRYAQGGSTLTQQLAKNMYLSSERTMLRKLDELTLALWLELRLEKREILELYLNQVYFGGGAYGIEAAAQRHFGKSASALSVVEGAIVAGLLKAPSRYSPTSNPAAARRRGRVVLQAMNEAGFLSGAELAKALTQSVRFARDGGENSAEGTEYAMDLILERMPALIGGDADSIIVETTIDSSLQKFAQRQLTQTLSRDGRKLNTGQGAIVVLDATGGIRALVGGADYAASQYNRATKAERQPGSTFKPFVYLTALEHGMKPETITYDLPLSIAGWAPRNANGQYRGEVTLRDALASSINTVAVRLALDFTPAKVADTARRAGIPGELREEPSLALGTSEVTLLDLTGAYALFANGGRRIQPYVIRRIISSSGRVLYADASDNSEAVVDLRHVGAMNDMLNAALVAGTGRKAAIETHPAAGKTGTSQDFRDAWFVGYTAHLTAGIWLGNDDGAPMDRVVGGSLPASIWRTVMSEAHKSLPVLPLPGTYRPGTRIGPDREHLLARDGTAAGQRGKLAAETGQDQTATNRLSPTRMRIAPPKSRVAQQPTGKSFAPVVPPPLPKLHKKPVLNRLAGTRSHPEEGISQDFIAHALEAVPADPAISGSQLAATTSGFDLDEIRRRLDKASSGNDGHKPYMALGAGQTGR